MSDKMPQVMQAVQAQHGFDPQYLYCQATGKPIGYVFTTELLEVIDSIPGTVEQIADDLAMRILASMRPSLKWNRLRESDLDTMRKQVPAETLSYLLNRLFEPDFNSSKFDWREINLNRIKLYEKLSDQPQGDFWDQCLLMLLELEAKLGLKSEKPSFGVIDILSAVDPIVALRDLLAPFHRRRIDFHRQSEADAIFFATNPGAKRAFFNAWMEAAPPTQAAIAKAERVQTANVMSAILDELMGLGDAKPTAHRPTESQMEMPKSAPTPSTKMPMRFGVKAAS